MSRRTSIADAFRKRVDECLNGTKTDKYYSNLYGNVSDKVYKFEEISEFPYVGIQVGTETFQYEPSRQKWNFLGISVFIYVRGEDDAEEQLELLIEDLKTIIDSEEDLHYTITKPDGSTVDAQTTEMTMNSVDTDEGMFKPFGFAEIQLTIRYTGDRRLYR
ncbi:hypothetical protein CPT_Slocum_177 [Serratia phage Slocum]|nr:hypothetical protein CPT_Slocum_177 [Serratia phage Slocum]